MYEERRTRRGADAPNALFTPEQAEAYRKRRREEQTTIAQLAAEAGCSYGTMQKLLSGERYRG
jgi:hypothetical protein